MANALLRGFEGIGRKDVALAGGKGASLGELTRAGLAVPPGFVIGTPAFIAFMDTLADPGGQRRRALGAIAADNLDAQRTAARGLRARIRATPLPGELLGPLEAAVTALAGADGQALAVRSSATAEDSAEASFAGLQDSYLWLRGAAAVAGAVRDCWASWYNDESVAYRRERGMAEEGLAMAVVVQRMVDPLAAGVMFSRSPLSGDRSVVAIEGSWGLGSCLVSGEVTPDRFVVNKVTGEVVVREIADKRMEHRPVPAGGVAAREVPEERRRIPCISDEVVRALAKLACAVEKHYGAAQDMEWALERGGAGRIHLLQSRPETVWAARERAPVMQPKASPFEHVFSVLGGPRKP